MMVLSTQKLWGGGKNAGVFAFSGLVSATQQRMQPNYRVRHKNDPIRKIKYLRKTAKRYNFN